MTPSKEKQVIQAKMEGFEYEAKAVCCSIFMRGNVIRDYAG